MKWATETVWADIDETGPWVEKDEAEAKLRKILEADGYYCEFGCDECSSSDCPLHPKYKGADHGT